MKEISKLHSNLSYTQVCELLGIPPAIRGKARDAQIVEIQRECYLHKHKNNRYTLAPINYLQVKQDKQTARQQEQIQKRLDKIAKGIINTYKYHEIDLDRKNYNSRAMQQLVLWFIEKHEHTSKTAYMSGFFSCLKYLDAIGNLPALYERYPRDVVVYADHLIVDRFGRRFNSYMNTLLDKGRISRECYYELANGKSIFEEDYNYFREIVIEEMIKDGMKADVFTVHFYPWHKEIFDLRIERYIHEALESKVCLKYTQYATDEALVNISQLDYDKLMVLFVEIMRESLLRSIRDKEAGDDFFLGEIDPEFQSWLLKFIEEFVVYISPQGEEIRTLDDVIDREANGDYQENACASIYATKRNIFTVANDNPYHPIRFNQLDFIRKAPLLGEAQAKRAIPADNALKGWNTDEKKINGFWEQRYGMA